MRLPRPDTSGLAMTHPFVIARSEATKQSPARMELLKGSTKTEAGHYVQVITAYLAGL